MASQVSEQTKRLQLQLGDGLPAIFSSMNAVVSQGTIRRDHGLAVLLSGYGSANSINFGGKLNVDVYGHELFASLPNGFGHLTPSFLPFQINLESENFSDYTYRCKFTIAGSILSRARVDQILSRVKACGDHPFVFEFRDSESGRLVGFLPTTASHIEKSLRLESGRGTPRDRNIFYGGELPNYAKKSSLKLWANWIKLMLLFSGLCWSVLLAPKWILSSAPEIPFFRHASANSSLTGALPLCPTNLSSAFVLGRLAEQLQAHVAISTNAFNQSFIDEILRASEIAVGRPTFSVTMADLANVPLEIHKLESSVSLIARFKRFFSFVNTMWLVAITGICVSIGPAIYHVLQPLQELLRKFCLFIFNEIIVPTVTRLHSFGIFEALGYALCAILLTEGLRMETTEVESYANHSAAGFYVALTGCLLVLPCALYSTLLWGNRPMQQISHRLLLELSQLWLGFSWIPIAIRFNSTLIGYAVTLLFFSYLGFTVVVGRLCLVIGFESYDMAARVCVTSLLMILCITALRVLNSDVLKASWLQPFLSPIAVFGGILYFLALMILCEKDFSYDDRVASGRNHGRGRDNRIQAPPSQRFTSSQKHLLVNLLMACSLVFFSFVGFVFQVEAFVNTSITFGVLWASHRYISFHMKNQFSPWVLMLLMSLLLWKVSLYLHMHPNFIVSLLQIV